MAFFDQMGQKLSQTGRDAVKKTKDMAERTALIDFLKKNDILAVFHYVPLHSAPAGRKIEGKYRQIGKDYYENYADKGDPIFQDCVDGIRRSEAAILEMKSAIQQLKGLLTCPSCGSELPVGTAFCNVCGAKLPEAQMNVEPAPPAGGIVCKVCGTVMQEGMSFCTNCGAKLE